MFDTLGVAQPRVLANRIEQYDDHRPAGDGGEHDDTAPGFTDVARLLQMDIPRAVLDQRIGIVEADRLAGGLYLDIMGGRGRVGTNQRVTGCRLHHVREIGGRGYIARRKTGGVLKVRARKSEQRGLCIHGLDKCDGATGIMAGECRCRTVFRRHQRELQHFVARQR